MSWQTKLLSMAWNPSAAKSILLLLLGPWIAAGVAPAAAVDPSLWRGLEGVPLPFRDDAEVLEFLRTATIISETPIAKGINESLKVLLEKDGVRAHAVFRRVSARRPSYRPPGSKHSTSFRDSCYFEPAAYVLGRRLGVRSIPPVVERRYRAKNGTLQIWVENAFDEQARVEQGLRPPHPDQWHRQRIVRQIFDALIYNIDRNQGNVLIDSDWNVWLIDSDWNVWLIDHTRAFLAQPELRARERIKRCDRDLWEHLQGVDRQAVATELEPFLTRRELLSLMIRWQKLVDHIRRLIAEHGESSVLF